MRDPSGRGRCDRPGQQLISIVDADPDLADLLDEGELERARHEALTRVQRLSPASGTRRLRWNPPLTIAAS